MDRLVCVSETEMTFDEWLKIGMGNNWCGPAVCFTHDGLPLSDAEDDELADGDPCIHVLRLYESDEQKNRVERDHAPSQWRKPL